MIRRGCRVSTKAAAWLFLLGGCRATEMAVDPVNAPTAEVRESADPGLVIDPATGHLLLSWVGGDSSSWHLYFSRSADQGTTWSPPVLITDRANDVQPHGESSPRLVAGPQGRLAAFWPNSIKVEGRKWPATQMRFARSLDGGHTWSPVITLNDDTTGTQVSHQFHGAAWQGDSGLAVPWLDERNSGQPEVSQPGTNHHTGDMTEEPDATIYMACSTDFGQTWSANRRMWGQACPCCRISLARRPNGEILSAWRKHFPENVRDVVTAQVGPDSVDPARVHQDDWVYPGCPHTGPAVAVDDRDGAHVVWYTGKTNAAGVFYQHLPAGAGSNAPAALLEERTLPTAHPAVAPLPDGGALVAFDVAPGGARWIVLARIGLSGQLTARQQIAGSDGGLYPQLAVAGPNSAVLAWTGRSGEIRTLHLARIGLR